MIKEPTITLTYTNNVTLDITEKDTDKKLDNKLQFNDDDKVLDMGTNKETIVKAPKTDERLEQIAKEQHEKRKAEEAADGSGADVEADGSGAALAQLTEEEKAQEARKAAELELTEIIAEAKKTSPDLNLIRVKRAEPLIRLKNILPKGEQPTFLFRNPGDTRNPRPRLQFSNTNNDIEEKIRIAKNAWSSNFNSEEFEEIFQIENINGNDKEITLKSPDTNLSRSELAKIIANNQLTPDELLDVRYLINSAGLNYVEEVENEKCKEQGDYCLDNQPGVLNIISIHVNKKIDPLKKQIKGILPNNHRIELQHPLIKT